MLQTHFFWFLAFFLVASNSNKTDEIKTRRRDCVFWYLFCVCPSSVCGMSPSSPSIENMQTLHSQLEINLPLLHSVGDQARLIRNDGRYREWIPRSIFQSLLIGWRQEWDMVDTSISCSLTKLHTKIQNRSKNNTGTTIYCIYNLRIEKVTLFEFESIGNRKHDNMWIAKDSDRRIWKAQYCTTKDWNRNR